MPRWFKITLWVVLGVGAFAFTAFQYLVWNISDTPWNFSGSSDAHWEARAAFLADLNLEDCASAQDIHTAAQALAFESWDVEGDFGWCHSPAGLRDWMGVEVMPGQMMSTRDENTQYFGFDVNMCAVPVIYDSGPNSTCPE